MTPTAQHQLLRVQPSAIAERMDDLLAELLTGAGAFVIEGLIGAAEIADARTLLMEHSERAADKVTHFQGGNEDRMHLQRRVWNLLNKGEVFEAMAQQPQICAVASRFLGDEFHLGSIAANRLLPGGPGQEPHIDYPYWDLYKQSSFPMNINSSFPMNLQATILIDDFTELNGATAMVPFSQGDLSYPKDPDAFSAAAIRQTGKAGDVVLFNGMCWHCAMPNNSNDDRTGVLIEYLPKFVRPLEDHSVVNDHVVERATPLLRQLLGLDYPYPQVLDEAEAVNAEGIK